MAAGDGESIGAYRVHTDKGSEEVPCVVEDVNPQRARVRLPAQQTFFHAGEDAIFKWTNPDSGEVILLPVIVGRPWSDGDTEVVELHFTDVNQIPAQRGQMTPMAARRRAPRASPSPEEKAVVTVQAHDSARGEPVPTKLLDISASGLAVELVIGTEPPQPVTLVQVNLLLPGESVALELPARLRHRTRESKTTVRYGLEFAEQSHTPGHAEKLELIAAWVAKRGPDSF